MRPSFQNQPSFLTFHVALASRDRDQDFCGREDSHLGVTVAPPQARSTLGSQYSICSCVPPRMSQKLQHHTACPLYPLGCLCILNVPSILCQIIYPNFLIRGRSLEEIWKMLCGHPCRRPLRPRAGWELETLAAEFQPYPLRGSPIKRVLPR